MVVSGREVQGISIIILDEYKILYACAGGFFCWWISLVISREGGGLWVCIPWKYQSSSWVAHCEKYAYDHARSKGYIIITLNI